METKRKYQIIIMSINGETFLGRIYNSWEEIHEVMIELRVLYAKNEVNHHVGYLKV